MKEELGFSAVGFFRLVRRQGRFSGQKLALESSVILANLGHPKNERWLQVDEDLVTGSFHHHITETLLRSVYEHARRTLSHMI